MTTWFGDFDLWGQPDNLSKNKIKIRFRLEICQPLVQNDQARIWPKPKSEIIPLDGDNQGSTYQTGRGSLVITPWLLLKSEFLSPLNYKYNNIYGLLVTPYIFLWIKILGKSSVYRRRRYLPTGSRWLIFVLNSGILASGLKGVPLRFWNLNESDKSVRLKNC